MSDRVTFTDSAAKRIARAVIAFEAGDRNGQGMTLGNAPVVSGDINFRICTFTGAWTKDAVKVVTYKYKTTTPNTATATNLFANIGTSVESVRNCAIARDGTAWFLVAAEC